MGVKNDIKNKKTNDKNIKNDKNENTKTKKNDKSGKGFSIEDIIWWEHCRGHYGPDKIYKMIRLQGQ